MRNLEHLRGVRLMFEKKNSKRGSRVKKKEKEKKTSVCVFLLLFSSFLQAKKNLFHSTTHNRHQISHSSRHSFFVARKKTHTLYIYIYIFLRLCDFSMIMV